MDVLPIGRLLTMVQNTVYALPARYCQCTVITSAGTINVSLDNSTFQAITLDSNKNFATSALFIKSTGGTSQITVE